MSDDQEAKPQRIWLLHGFGVTGGDTWSEIRNPTDLPDDEVEATEYVRADRIAELEARLDEQELFEGEALQGHDTQEARAEDAEVERERLRGTLTRAATRFRWYEELHRAKPDHDKANRNAEFAEDCERALAADQQPDPSVRAKNAHTGDAADQPQQGEGERENGMADVSWERQLERTRDDAWNAALEEAAKTAEWAHMVPPDGGSPSNAEYEVAKEAAFRIRNLKRDTTP